MGHGKADTEEEVDALVEYIEKELDRRRPKRAEAAPTDATS